MDIKKIEDYEKEKNIIIPEAYIQFILESNNMPEKLCKDYPEIYLYDFELFKEMNECYSENFGHNGENLAPNYLSIGCGGGSELLVIKQEKSANQLIITTAGNYIEEYLTPEHCKILMDFKGWINKGCPYSEINS